MLKFITPFIATLTLVATLAAGPASAKPRSEGYRNPHQNIYTAAENVGYKVDNYAPECKKPGLFGFVEHRGKTPSRFVICTNNATTLTQAYTIIRHEGIHVAQICKGGLIYPKAEDAFIARAQDEGWNILGYPAKVWGTEAEARVLANEWTAQEVVQAINTFCF